MEAAFTPTEEVVLDNGDRDYMNDLWNMLNGTGSNLGSIPHEDRSTPYDNFFKTVINSIMREVNTGDDMSEEEEEEEELNRAIALGEEPKLIMCVICMEEVTIGSQLTTRLPCSHLFHGDCLSQWLLRNQSCPLSCHKLPSQ
ncbi:hypothetical protein TIFTF001_003708 [Ficus carica]|uniref:RING-type E3 ubiquitin transferase n=1 Tax=Ficus carica TaxID=3494 RepID=A0AA87ZG38_FICCA|nr:hypothetical protein TIFTF001_003708 [Ficus carica]